MMPLEDPPDSVEFGTLERWESRLFCEVPLADFDPIPKDEWHDVDTSNLVLWIRSQVDGMCTSNAFCTAVEMQRKMQGLIETKLAAEDLYARVGRWGTGSTLPDNVSELVNKGVQSRAYVSEDQWPVRDPASGDAEHFKVLEFQDLQGNVDMVVSSVLRRFPTIIGISWPGGGGHAIAVTKYTVSNNSLGGPNSWGATWNGDGYWDLSLDYIRRSIGRYGAYCIRSVTHSNP